MRAALTLILLSLSVPALAATPECAGGVEIANAKIVRVEQNGALILSDGRAAMLEGIRLPLNDGASRALLEDAIDDLRALAMAQPMTLTAVAPKQDRYDRVRVQAFGRVWLQEELLKRGMARVAIAPDRAECAAELYKVEQEARAGAQGLWAYPAFSVRTPATVSRADEGKFLVVEGRVVNGALRDGRVSLDFSSDTKSGLSGIIAPEDHANFRRTNPPPESLTGHTIRLRGLVVDINGKPQIGISNPAQIEFVN